MSACETLRSSASLRKVKNFLIDQTNPDKNQILGDHVNDGGGIANATTTGTVIFYAVMLDRYVDANSGESVKMGDSLGDNATLIASRIDPATCISGTCCVIAGHPCNCATGGDWA